jgi:hypothetical protein
MTRGYGRVRCRACLGGVGESIMRVKPARVIDGQIKESEQWDGQEQRGHGNGRVSVVLMVYLSLASKLSNRSYRRWSTVQDAAHRSHLPDILTFGESSVYSHHKPLILLGGIEI